MTLLFYLLLLYTCTTIRSQLFKFHVTNIVCVVSAIAFISENMYNECELDSKINVKQR